MELHSRVLQIMGKKNSGKTTLMNNLIRNLTARGFRVGSLKHSPHPHPVDKEGSDSFQHRRSGATPAAFQTPDGLGIFYPASKQESEEADGIQLQESILKQVYESCDILLVESYHGNYGPVIAILDSDEMPGEGGGRIFAVVNRQGKHMAYRAFSFDDENLIKQIVQWMKRPGGEP